MKSNTVFNRRSFLKTLGLAALAAPYVARTSWAVSPNETLHHASFGATGMAGADIGELTKHEAVRLVAVAEVDLTRARDLQARFPRMRVYQDWRRMLEIEKGIDSVNVSTPDHMHAPMAMSAMQLGKHVYGQKPLTHDIYETRQLTLMARKKKLVTQMGIQIHSSSEYQQAVKVVREMAAGPIKEVHTWSSKKWGDMDPLPNRQDPVPTGFKWDLWLGVAADRPFIGGGYYHPGNWRKRLDFGTGTFGDMGCHIFDPVFKALDLTAPISVTSRGPAPNEWNWAINAVIEYVFPGTQYTEGKTIKIVWYDGDALPPKEIQALLGKEKLPDQGSIFVGTKGSVLLPHIGQARLLPDDKFDDYKLPRVPSSNHWHQFVDACLGKGQTLAPFDYSGPLTESVLLGSVATRFRDTTLDWDAAGLRFSNLKEANQYVRRTYRKGWEVKGLS